MNLQGFRNQYCSTPGGVKPPSFNGIQFMAPSRYSNRTYRRSPSIVDCALALSVIVGLVFVSVRMMNMGGPPVLTQTAETGPAMAKVETPPAPDVVDTKTP
jgi:hypothetical protein